MKHGDRQCGDSVFECALSLLHITLSMYGPLSHKLITHQFPSQSHMPLQMNIKMEQNWQKETTKCSLEYWTIGELMISTTIS